MTIQMTQLQFDTLLERLAPGGGGGGNRMVAGAASVVGQLAPCNLGRNKLKRYKKFLDWSKEAESKMSFLGIEEDRQKVNFLKSTAGPELTQFWEKEVRIRFEAVEADAGREILAQAANTYKEIVEESKKTLLKIINKDRAIIDMMKLNQGDQTFMEFLAVVEDQEHLCRADEVRITSDDLKRMALIAGMKDRNLAEKCIGEEYSLKQVIQAGVNRENSKANVEAMQSRPVSQVKRMEQNRSFSEGDLDDRVETLRKELEDVMKIRKTSGRYSGRSREGGEEKCKRCTYSHDKERRCPAEGRRCNRCQEEGHFGGSALCKASGWRPSSGKKKEVGARRVEEEEDSDSSDATEWHGDEEPVIKLVRPSRVWPGVKKGGQVKDVQYVARRGVKKTKTSRWVRMTVGGRRMKLFSDTGSKFTIIPPELYEEGMGVLREADCNLRAWGADTYLDVKGMVNTELVTKKGARKKTDVYVVGGTRPEPLLGDTDAEDLGIIIFVAEGREATEQEKKMKTGETVARVKKEEEELTQEQKKSSSIPNMLRRAGKKIDTRKPEIKGFSAEEKKKTMKIVNYFKGSVFSDRIGLIKTPPVELQYEKGFKAVQPHRYGVPYHYQARLDEHLDRLTAEGIIEDVEPREKVDIVLNVAISEKKTAGSIRMNIDARPLNVGAKHTKYHVITPQEVRHQLRGARVFSEADMGDAFHQLPLARSSNVVFQTHRGLHRMKRMFFGPKSSSGIFHHEVQKAFRGIEGCITIHDNILIFGKDHQDHNKNLQEVLRRAQEKGVTLKMSKSTFCEPQVNWFGRIFSEAGVSADPEKIRRMVEAGRPDSSEDVRSLLQAAAYNARFAFDHNEDETYEEVTAPLRELLTKGKHFRWDARRERSYQKLMRMMSDASILVAYNPDRKTHLVTDASPKGIAASLYQEDEEGRWLPVDHASRALSLTEQRWESQIDWESLAKSWGMLMFRHFLIGAHFTSWGDHLPLLPFYNDLNKTAPVRVNKHRNKICDLSFTDKYLKGREVPADFSSRHPNPIDNLTKEEREQLYIDDGEDNQIMRVMMADLPDALSMELIRQAADTDPVYQKLKVAVKAGSKRLDRDLVPYTSVWAELGVVDDLVCRGEKVVIPDGHLARDEGNLRDWVVELGHSGHMGVEATKRLLRQRLWFPGMDRKVERRAAECLACQATTKNYYRDPLKPNKAPEEPWQRLSCDHWGPTRDNKHLLVVIDNLTRYPEVAVVDGTSAEDNIHSFSEIFSRHGYPAVLHSDNGAPFNGNDSHLLQEYFRSIGVKHVPNHSAEDPESTGGVEAFMKHIARIFRTAEVNYEDPYLKMNDYLMMVRASPHASTGKSPAELLFGRKFITKIPDMRTSMAKGRQDIQEAREKDNRAKEVMKEQKDKGKYVRPHNIQEGDKVLLQRKTTKHNGPYDPKAYTVTKTWGTQVQAERQGEVKKRDSQRWKKVEVKEAQTFKVPGRRETGQDRQSYREDKDVGATRGQEERGARHGRGPPPAARQGQGPPPAREQEHRHGQGHPPGQVQEHHQEADQPPDPEDRGQQDHGIHPVNQQYPQRQDIKERLKRNREVILDDTFANRPKRKREAPKDIYTASTSGFKSRAAKKLPPSKPL